MQRFRGSLRLHLIWVSALLVLAAPARTSQPPQAVKYRMSSTSEGARLFIAYNCIDCHGPDGVGLMAPSLQDGRWRFGGSEDSVYSSIADGRPEGMPAWRRMMPAQDLRTLTAYVRTLGKDVTTMSFVTREGSVSRPGH